MNLESTKFDIKRNRPKTDYKGVVGRLGKFNEVLGSRRVDSITPIDIENYQLQRQRAGLKPATIDQQITNVKTMVKKAFYAYMSNGKAQKAFNAWGRMLERGSNARKRTNTAKEYLLLLKHVPEHSRCIIVVLMNTGMRVSEARQLRWSYVDRKAGVIRLPKEILKQNAPRIVPINHHVEKVLDRQLRAVHHDFIFTYRGKPLGRLKGAWQSFQKACKDAEIPYGRDAEGGITAHDFRRTVKTNMVAAGVDAAYRNTILGHSMQGMDRHYIKPSVADLKAAMDRYTEWLDARLSESLAQNLAQLKPSNL